MAIDTHIEIKSTPGGPVLIPVPHRFDGEFVRGLAPRIRLNGEPLALHGSVARTNADHFPKIGESFVNPPTKEGAVMVSTRAPGFFVDGVPVAVHMDTAITCDDVPGLDAYVVVADQRFHLVTRQVDAPGQPNYDRRFVLRYDDGTPLGGVRYRVHRADGGTVEGRTQADGRTDLVVSDFPEVVRIELPGEEA